jgi:predicted hotdog family 3-hydroxylacyl-ACP dehydratase
MSDAKNLYRALPHSGDMRLIDEVTHWDTDIVTCLTASHQRSDNPLRVGHQLPVLCGLEYAAQASALHGTLIADRAQAIDSSDAAAYLVSARKIEWFGKTLDGEPGRLEIRNRILLRQTDAAMYQFTIAVEKRVLICGEIGLMFRA